MQLPQILSNQTVGAEINSANARELHVFLNSEQEFANWIKNRITQYGFTENQDYIVKTTYTGRRPRKEYFITLDMAKELCMVENNERGKEARQYFIKCEKELQALKFQHYVNKISALEADFRLKATHHQNQINGYKSQIAKHNNQIELLKAELVLAKKNDPFAELDLSDPKYQPFSAGRPSYKELWGQYISIKAHNNALKVALKMFQDDKDKNKQIALNLAKIQQELEKSYTAIGAVMAYCYDNDRFFIENNEILKG